jgi:hypothetical protein
MYNNSNCVAYYFFLEMPYIDTARKRLSSFAQSERKQCRDRLRSTTSDIRPCTQLYNAVRATINAAFSDDARFSNGFLNRLLSELEALFDETKGEKFKSRSVDVPAMLGNSFDSLRRQVVSQVDWCLNKQQEQDALNQLKRAEEKRDAAQELAIQENIQRGKSDIQLFLEAEDICLEDLAERLSENLQAYCLENASSFLSALASTSEWKGEQVSSESCTLVKNLIRRFVRSISASVSHVCSTLQTNNNGLAFVVHDIRRSARNFDMSEVDDKDMAYHFNEEMISFLDITLEEVSSFGELMTISGNRKSFFSLKEIQSYLLPLTREAIEAGTGHMIPFSNSEDLHILSVVCKTKRFSHKKTKERTIRRIKAQANNEFHGGLNLRSLADISTRISFLQNQKRPAVGVPRSDLALADSSEVSRFHAPEVHVATTKTSPLHQWPLNLRDGAPTATKDEHPPPPPDFEEGQELLLEAENVAVAASPITPDASDALDLGTDAGGDYNAAIRSKTSIGTEDDSIVVVDAKVTEGISDIDVKKAIEAQKENIPELEPVPPALSGFIRAIIDEMYAKYCAANPKESVLTELEALLERIHGHHPSSLLWIKGQMKPYLEILQHFKQSVNKALAQLRKGVEQLSFDTIADIEGRLTFYKTCATAVGDLHEKAIAQRKNYDDLVATVERMRLDMEAARVYFSAEQLSTRFFGTDPVELIGKDLAFLLEGSDEKIAMRVEALIEAISGVEDDFEQIEEQLSNAAMRGKLHAVISAIEDLQLHSTRLLQYPIHRTGAFNVSQMDFSPPEREEEGGLDPDEAAEDGNESVDGDDTVASEKDKLYLFRVYEGSKSLRITRLQVELVLISSSWGTIDKMRGFSSEQFSSAYNAVYEPETPVTETDIDEALNNDDISSFYSAPKKIKKGRKPLKSGGPPSNVKAKRRIPFIRYQFEGHKGLRYVPTCMQELMRDAVEERDELASLRLTLRQRISLELHKESKLSGHKPLKRRQGRVILSELDDPFSISKEVLEQSRTGVGYAKAE